MEWTFGLSQNEITMALLGFAVQNEFFLRMGESQGFLRDLALTSGLIGFVTIALMIGRIHALQIVAWFLLLLIVLARPLSEPALFVTLGHKNLPVLNETPSIGGTFTQAEWTETVGKVPKTETYNDRLERYGYKNINALTPQLVAISALNQINVGFSEEFLAPGRRLLAGYQPAIESIRRGRLASNTTKDYLAQFMAVCTGDDSGAAKRLSAAYIPFGQLEKQGSTSIIEALQNKRIKAREAVTLLGMYNTHTKQKEGAALEKTLLPTLVCPADGCGEAGQKVGKVKNKYPEVFDRFFNRVVAKGPEDFVRVRDNRETVMFDVDSSVGSMGGGVGIRQKLEEQDVSLAVPLNANAIASSIDFEPAKEGTSKGWDASRVINGSVVVASATGGCAAGALAGAAAGGFAASVVPFVGTVVGAVVGGTLGCLVGGSAVGVTANAVLPEKWDVQLFEGAARKSATNTEKVFVVSDCADFHRLTDARLLVDVGVANKLTSSLKDLMQSGELPPDFDQMTPEQQAKFGLHSALAAQLKRCDSIGGRLSNFNVTREGRREDVSKNIGELVTYAQTVAANNVLPELTSSAHAENAMNPSFTGASREIISGAGRLLTPLGVASVVGVHFVYADYWCCLFSIGENNFHCD